MCQMLIIWNVDVYLYHENPLNLRGEMGNGPLRDRTLEGSRFTSSLWEAYHDLDPVGLDRDLDTAFTALDGDHEDRLTSCRDGSGAR